MPTAEPPRRAAGFQEAVELFFFRGEGGFERDERFFHAIEKQDRGEAHRGGEDVVGGLAEVDVVVRVDERVVAARATEDFDRAVGDHLVRVHVE